MAKPDETSDSIFLPGGWLRADRITPMAMEALRESTRIARETRWDSVRSPHVFMGILSHPDAPVQLWGRRLQADFPCLLRQFQDLFCQEPGIEDPVLSLNREFLSDNVIRLLRDAMNRAQENNRDKITSMDLLVCMLTAQRSIVAECFERLGITAAKLTEQAVIAEFARADTH
jgi:ATP-dependent Clp protease ATP-binding subunit ClpA